jgi:TonB family protein
MPPGHFRQIKKLDEIHRIRWPQATNVQRLRHRHSACEQLYVRGNLEISEQPTVHDFAGTPIVSDLPRERVPTGESLVVLTRDNALVETLKVLGSEHNIVTVDAESDLAGELVGKQMGVAIIDAAAAATAVERLTEKLKSQFPDLVLIVAGRLDDQSALAAQITSGTVYRFLHKPVSEQRVKLFVDAAWRRHGEELSGVADPMASTGVIPDDRAPLPRNVLLIGSAILLALVLAGGWFMTRKPPPAPAAKTASTTQTDAQFESLLSRADAALTAGTLVAPPGQNAADLYKQALHRNGSDPRPAAGIEKVIDKLLSAAEDQLGAQRLDEAQRLIEQARAIEPDHVRVAFLSAQIGKERERSVLTQARQAASSGNIEQAIAVLDGASKDGKHSTLVAEARQELEQKKLDDRVGDYLSQAADRLRSGQLVEPPQDNARFFIESARAVAPNEPQVHQAQKQLEDRLVAEVRKSLGAGNVEQAQHWIDAAADSGVSHEEITDLTREAQRAQTSAKADAMARLTLLFNQRLTQGKVIDPPSDSAKFYLAQLVRSDATHPSTVLARQALAGRTLDEAKAAVRRQDFVGARRWLAETHDAGTDDASISAVEHDMTTVQDTAKHAAEIMSAGNLELVKYVPPTFPVSARDRGLSGWVDVQFVVKSDGLVSDVIITGAEPVGLFEQAAVDAVRKWRYKPVERDGHAVDQRARLRMKFALDK